MADSIDTQVSADQAKYGAEITQAYQPLLEDMRSLVKEQKEAGEQGVKLAQDFAAQQTKFSEPEPHDQINEIMAGAPWLFALAALGGKISGAGGMAMIDSLNGMSDGIIKGDQQSLANHWKNYQAAYNKWAANEDQKFRIYQTMQQAYAGQADGNLRAHAMAMKMVGDFTDRKLDVDDPKRHYEMVAKIKEGNAHLIEANARMMEAQTKKKLADVGGGSGSVDDVAQAIAEYRLAPLTGFAMKSPWGQAVMSEVTKINPDYHAEEFGSRSKAYRDFATGKQGDQARFLNTAIGHLDTVEELSQAIDKGDLLLVNKLLVEYARQTGSPAVSGFDAAAGIVGQEVVKAVVANGGGEAERQEASKKLDAALPQRAIHGVVQSYQALFGTQMEGLQRQYEQSTGRHDFARLLSERTQEVLEHKSRDVDWSKFEVGKQYRDSKSGEVKIYKGNGVFE